MSTSEVDTWHYIKKLKIKKKIEKKKHTPLAGLGWPKHPPWGGSATPWQKKKKIKIDFGPWGWFGHPKGQTFQILFFPFCPWSGRTTSVALGGSLATPKDKTDLAIFLFFIFYVQGVAEPPHHPRLASHPLFKKKKSFFLIKNLINF